MKRTDYSKQIKVWTAQYMNDPTTEQAAKFNPSAFKIKPCAKCGRITKRSLERHHKGHEFLFSNILPSKYAKRYLQFHPDDIAYLCKRCHGNETRYSKKVIQRIVNEFKTKGMTYERCEYWRGYLIKMFNKWVKLPPRRRNVHTRQPPTHFLDSNIS